MRTLKLQTQITADGFMAGTDGQLDWMTAKWTEDLNQFVGELSKPVDTILLGRKLAEGFIPYWAGVAADPKNPENDAGKKFTETPKIVFTQTLNTTDWPNTELSKEDIVPTVSDLKSKKGGDIIAYGGANFVSSLAENNLIDDYYLFVNPVSIGKGLSIFNQLTEFKLKQSIPFECGIVLLHYQPQNKRS